jgi:protoheme IX farnesyltransferase
MLVLLTGAAALVWEGSMLSRPLDFLLVMIGLYLTGGCANALNQYLERDVDADRSRTRQRRPLPLGALTAGQALVFSVAIGAIGVALFAFAFNRLTAALSLLTIVFYAFVYTLWLKPNTDLNIVIGGAAGAMAPVGAWAAATGGTSLAPWAIFALVFLWTPPHFWSLALVYQDDYRRIDYPMLPLTRGVDATLRQIVAYCWALLGASFLPLLSGASWLYAGVALILGAMFLHKALQARARKSQASIPAVFRLSIAHLLFLLAALIFDRLLLSPLDLFG